MKQVLRAIPAVERVIQALGALELPRPLVTAVVRRKLALYRVDKQVPAWDVILAEVRAALETLRQARLRPVINATGILVHTNLGRAPLGPEVIQALTDAGGTYTNLEYDLAKGERGSRASYVETALALLCRAEGATVVNNCAAALVLTLRQFTRTRPEVIISRGELVQIGGGFRIPDILEASGAKLREVGSTNQTLLSDYEQAISATTGMILKVHRSNFFMDGFTGSPGTSDIAALAHRKGLPFVEDLGSGALVPTEQIEGIDHEPTPGEVLRNGVDLVTFSGDKLFGGPQAGIIAGKGKMIARLKREPFFRALRCDKLILAALQTTVDTYLNGTQDSSVPVLQMLHVSTETLRARAERIRGTLQKLPVNSRVGEGKGQVGGGTLPRSVLASVTLDLTPKRISVLELAGRLRARSPAVIGYTARGCLKLDLRTVFPSQDDALAQAIATALTAPPGQIKSAELGARFRILSSPRPAMLIMARARSSKLLRASTRTACRRRRREASRSILASRTWVWPRQVPCPIRSISGSWTSLDTRISSRTWSRAWAGETWPCWSWPRTTAGCRKRRSTCRSSRISESAARWSR
jgi:L-seryl-tRNA(Ser) seleniumtransferase